MTYHPISKVDRSLVGLVMYVYDTTCSDQNAPIRVVTIKDLTYIFKSRKDMIKTMNITTALIRKVVPPSKSYKIPPVISPMILASPPKLPATPCTAP